MNVALDHTQHIARRSFTVDDVRRMIEAGVIGEDERFELVEGDLLMMQAKSIAHERIKSALIVGIARVIPNALVLGVETTLRLTERTMLEPDIAIFPRTLFDQPRDSYAGLAPGEALLVIEVAFSSLAYDKELKARLYARHRVHEYWVIDADAVTTWVHSDPAEGAWRSIVQKGAAEVLTTPALPGFSIRLDEIR